METLTTVERNRLVDLATSPYDALPAAEKAEFRRLVDKLVPGEVEAVKKEKAARVERLEQLRRQARRPPQKGRLEPGDARLPIGVLDDVYAGKLIPLDLAVLGVYLLTFSSGDLDQGQAASGLLRWDGEWIVSRGTGAHGGVQLLEQWDGDVAPDLGVIAPKWRYILGRLAAAGWLRVEVRHGETAVAPGPRLSEA
jgi:hypothetical protein